MTLRTVDDVFDALSPCELRTLLSEIDLVTVATLHAASNEVQRAVLRQNLPYDRVRWLDAELEGWTPSPSFIEPHLGWILSVANDVHRLSGDLKDVYQVLSKMHDVAAAKGLLALEEHLDASDEPLFRELVWLMTTGMDPAIVEETSKSRLAGSLDRRRRYLEALREGMVAIQRGADSERLREIVDSKIDS